MKEIKLFLILLFLGLNVYAQKIDKIEPPYWWADMNHNQLEIMIYGKDIAKYKPTIANETIQLVEVKNTENDNYLFSQEYLL